MKIVFSDDFLKYTSGHREIEVKGSTVLDGMKELFDRFPQLVVFLMDKDGGEADRTSICLDGEKYLYATEHLMTEVTDGSVIEIGRDVPEGQKGAFQFLAAAVMIVVGVYTGNYALVASGIAMAIGAVGTLLMGDPKLPSMDGEDSATYSWRGIQNTTVSGTPVAIVYGRHRVGGQLLNVYTDTVGKSDSYLHAQIGVCEGPVEDIYDVQVNGKSVDSYAKVETAHRLGTPDQEVLDGFNQVENTISLTGQKVTNSGTIVELIDPVDKLKVCVTAPALYRMGETGMKSVKVVYDIWYRPHGSDGEWTQVLDGSEHSDFVSGKTKSETLNYTDVLLPERGAYDIKVTRVTADHSTTMEYVDDIYVKSINCITEVQLAYPNTALLGMHIKATDQLSGSMPTITSMVKGRTVKVPTGYNGAFRKWDVAWDGTFSDAREWTDNPAWCLFDLLTDRRLGLGRYLRLNPALHSLMVAQFVMLANYCDEQVATGEQYVGTYFTPEGATATRLDLTGTASATLGVGQIVRVDGTEHEARVTHIYNTSVYLDTVLPYDEGTKLTVSSYEPRFSLNVVIDTMQKAVDVLTSIVSVMRASMFYSEGRLHVDIDRPKPISHLYTMSNIIDKSFTRTSASRKETPNVIEVQFPNSALDYERDVFRVESPTLRENPYEEERTKSLNLTGVTSYAQALRAALYILHSGRYTGSVVTFKTGTDGMQCMVGDVIGVQHDVPQWGWGGRVATTDGSGISLSTPVELNISYDYAIQFNHKSEDADGNLTPLVVPIEFDVAGADGNGMKTVSEVTLAEALPQDVEVAAGDLYVIGETTNAVKPFRVSMLRRAEDETFEITAIDYNESLYDLCDSTDGSAALIETNYSRIQDPQSVVVGDVNVSERSYIDVVGNLVVGAEVTYTPPVDNSFWDGAVVMYSESGTGVFDTVPVNRTGYVYITGLEPNTAYEFVVLSQFKDGTRQTLEQVLTMTGGIPTGSITVGGLPKAGALPTVKGLELFGQGNDAVFSTQDAKFAWRATSLDVSVDLGDASYEAGEGFLSSMFKDYRIEIWANNQRRRVDYTTATSYVYGYTANCDDGSGTAARTFTIKVWVRDKFNRMSETPAQLTVTNPQLDAVTNLSAAAAIGGCTLAWDAIEASDFAGYKVWASTEGVDFTPSEASLIYYGKNNSVTLSNLNLGYTWHFKVAAYDFFGADSLNYAGASFEVTSLDLFDTEPPAVPTNLGASRTDSVVGSTIQASWDANSEADLNHYLVRIRKDGEIAYVAYPAYTTSFLAEGFSAAVTYHVSVCAVDRSGNASEWASEVAVAPAADTDAPAAPTNLSIACAFRAVFLEWENPTDADFDHCEVYGGASEDVAESILLGEVKGNAFTDVLSGYGEQKNYWVRAVDLSDNVSEWAGPVAASAGRVQTTDIETFAIDASKLFTKIPVIEGDAWQDQQGDGSSVSWNEHQLYYNGEQYTIAAGSSPSKYIYWVSGASAYAVSATYPTLGNDDFIIATNVGGDHDLAWNAIANEVIGSAHIQEAAIQDLHVDNLSGDKIRVATLNGDRVVADTLDAKAIKAGTLTADQIVSFGSGVSLDGFIETNVDNTGATAPGMFSVGTWDDAGGKVYGDETIPVHVAGEPYSVTGGSVIGDGANAKSRMLMFTTDPSRFSAVITANPSQCSHMFQVYQAGSQWYVDDGDVGSDGTSGVAFTFNASTDYIVGTFDWGSGSISGWQPTLTAQTTISGNRITTGVIDASKVTIDNLTVNYEIQVTGKPTSLSAINSTEGTKLSEIADGATVGAPSGTSVGGQTADDVASWSSNPAAKVNANETLIQPGKVLISGDQALDSWSHDSDATFIDGGKLYTGSVVADKLTIGMQPNLVRKGFDCFDFIPEGTSLPADTNVESALVSSTKSYAGRHALAVRSASVDTYIPRVFLGATVADTHIPLTGGQDYIISGYLYVASATAVDGVLGLMLESTSYLDCPFTGISSADGWVRISTKVSVPIGENFGMICAGVGATGVTVYFDCLQVEQVVGTAIEAGSWRPGGTTVIDGGLVSANSINGDHIRADSTIIIGQLDGVSDYVVLDGEEGTVKSFKYLAGAMRQYRSLTRRESGAATSGQAVTIPGYFESQPDIQVSINTLTSYDPAYANQKQTWSCRAEAITEESEGQWSFVPVAQLELGEASGTAAFNETYETSSDTYVSAVQELPENTEAATVAVRLKSILGTGVSSTYYKRQVSWRVGYSTSADGTFLWTNWQAVAIGATLEAVNATMDVTFPSSQAWYIKVEYLAENAGGTFTTGAVQYDYWSDTKQNLPAVSTSVLSDAYYPSGTQDSDSATLELPLGSYTPPTGYSVYNVEYSFDYAYHLLCDIEGSDPYPYTSAEVSGPGFSQSVSHSGEAGSSSLDNWTTKTATAASYDPAYLTSSVNSQATASLVSTWAQAEAELSLRNGEAIIYSRKVQSNTAHANDFDTMNATYTLSSAQILATGVLNWLAIGE